MKKLLGVSIAAMLAVTPMLASADPASGNHLSNAAPTETSGSAPFKAVTVDQTAKIATTSYVQGAYNDAIAAVNKVATVANAGQTETQVKALIGAAAAGATDGLTGDAEAGTLAINYDNSTIDLVASGDNAGKLEVKAGGITATQLATNAVETTKINAKAVTTAKIDDKAVTAAQIADNTITASQIANATITSTQLAADSVTSTQIADGAVGLAKIASGDKQGASDTTNYTNTKLANAAYVDETVATAVADKATKSGVTATISASTISGTVPVYTAWGADTNTTVAITAGITGAAYAEPAPAQTEP